MNQEEIISNLENLNFSKLEAQIYMALVDGGPLSGYQLAKKIDISRSSIYNALDHMYEKGMVSLISDSSSNYIAEKPGVLFPKLTFEYNMNATKAKERLIELAKFSPEEKYANFKGFETAIFKTKELLMEAKQSVFINTDFDLDCFDEEFKSLKKRGIRVIVFSFLKLNVPTKLVEFYTHNRSKKEKHIPSRLMIVVGDKEALVADYNRQRGCWQGTTTNNSLMVSIVREHIHNDIYLLRLRDKYGKDFFNDNIRINTDFENQNDD